MGWENPEDYAYTKAHTLKDWAWEFIRRNPAYTQKWEALQLHVEQKAPPLTIPKVQDANGNIIETATHYSYGFREGFQEDSQYSGKWQSTIKRGDENFFIPSFGENPWFLSYYYNPERKVLDPFAFTWGPVIAANPYGEAIPIIAREQEERMGLLSNGLCPPHTLLAAFDLCEPIESQIRAVESELKKHRNYLCKQEKQKIKVYNKARKEVTKEDQKRWTCYLRILDASNAGARLQQAAPIIFSDIALGATLQEGYKETKKQAKTMVKEGYKTLLQAPYQKRK